MPGCRLSTADVVRDIVNLLDRAADQTPISASQAVIVRLDRLPQTAADDVQFALKRLPPGVHPMAYLDGFVAPPTWAGIGIIAHGRARSVDDPAAGMGRARVVSVLTRDGMLGSLLHLDGGQPQVTVEPVGTGVVGELPLALCRALGVPFTRTARAGVPEGDSA